MKIKLAFPRGFCAGVNRATSALHEALTRYGAPVYVYHEIVHNKWVVEYFRQAGAIFVQSLEQIPDGSVLLFSAHGVSPQTEQLAIQKRLKYIDASCPLVKKVHTEAKRFVQQGYDVILIGHPHHDEVEGVQGEAPDKIWVVDSVDAIEQLSQKAYFSDNSKSDQRKIAYITQTTLSMVEAAKMIQLLKHKFPGIVGPSVKDICYATQNRQNAVKQISASLKRQNPDNSAKAIIVGSTNSSNSIRLAEIARTEGLETFLIDGPDDINANQFNSSDTILLTAGASAHERIVQKVVEFFRVHFDAQLEEVRLCEENTIFRLPEMPADCPTEDSIK